MSTKNFFRNQLSKISLKRRLIIHLVLFCLIIWGGQSLPAQTVLALQTSTAPTGANLLQAYFINVAQGNCILVKFPSGGMLLYDAGSTSSGVDPAYIARKFDTITGGANIGTVVLSHPDDDHINLVPYINQARNPQYVHISQTQADYGPIAPWFTTVTGNGATVVTYTANFWSANPLTNIANSGACKVYVLAANVAGDPNTNSIVMSIDYKNDNILLTGDATAITERFILRYWDDASLLTTLLSFGHHGSNHSSTKKFLAAASPNIGIFSASASHMGYGHPRCSIVDAVEKIVDSNGSKVGVATHQIDCFDRNTGGYVTEHNDLGIFLTATQGNIRFRCDGQNHYDIYVDRLQ